MLPTLGRVGRQQQQAAHQLLAALCRVRSLAAGSARPTSRELAVAPAAARCAGHALARDQEAARRAWQDQAPTFAARGRSSNEPRSPAKLTTDILATSSLEALRRLLAQHAESLQLINTCAGFKAVVRLAGAAASDSGRGSEAQAAALAVLRQLNQHVLAHIRSARAWDLAQAAWACSKLGHRDERLLDAIGEQAGRKALLLQPQDITQLASACQRLGYSPPGLAELLLQQAIAKADGFRPWALVHTAWALHARGSDVSQLLQAATVLLPGRLAELSARDFSTLLWLLAKAQRTDRPVPGAPQLLDAAGEVLAGRIGSFAPAFVAQILQSAARLRWAQAPLLFAAADAAGFDARQLQQAAKPQQRQPAAPARCMQETHAAVQQQQQAPQEAQQQQHQMPLGWADVIAPAG